MIQLLHRDGLLITFCSIGLFILTLQSCGSDVPASRDENQDSSRPKIDLSLSGQELFVKNCKLCHGIDGSLELNGAKDLRYSTMALDERISLIRDGKNAMTPFKKVLKEADIRKVAEYSMTLKTTE